VEVEVEEEVERRDGRGDEVRLEEEKKRKRRRRRTWTRLAMLVPRYRGYDYAVHAMAMAGMAGTSAPVVANRDGHVPPVPLRHPQAGTKGDVPACM
jgi:hypothetical protein